MTDEPKTILQTRVTERMQALGKKALPLAKSLGYGDSFIRDLLRKGAMPGADRLAKLAEALQTTPAYLLGETDTVEPSLGPAVLRTGAPLPYAGVVQAGAFLAVDEYFQQDTFEVPEFVLAVPRFGKVKQYAYQARGGSMTGVGISDGDWIVAAAAGDFIDTYGETETGDLVVVERTRFQRSERELTIKEIHYFKDRYELRPRSADPSYKPIIVPLNHTADGDEFEVTIVGVVLTAYKDFRRKR
jgi:repressor LexA